MKRSFVDCTYPLKSVFRDIKTNKPIVITEKTRLEHGLCICRTGGGKTSTFLLPCIYETILRKLMNREIQQKVMRELYYKGHVDIILDFPNQTFCLRCFTPLTEYGREAMVNLSNNCDDAAIVSISTDSSFGKSIREMCLNANYNNYYCIDPELFKNDGKEPYDTPYGINPLFIPPELPVTDKIQRANNRAELLAENISKIADAISDKPSDPFYMSLNHSIIKTISQVLMLSFYDIEGKHPTLRDVLTCLLDYRKLEPYMFKLAENYGNDGRPMSFTPPTINDYRINCGESLSVLYDFAKRLVTSNERSVIVTQAEGLMNAMNRLLGNISVARMLCSDNSVDIDKLIAQSSVILFNTAIGISDTTSSFLGQLYTMVYKDAILQRKKDDNSGRSMRDPIVFFFADEVASYLTKHMEPLVTLMRGYRASSYLAIQSNSQFDKVSSTRYLKYVFNENPALVVRMGGMGMKEAEELEKESKPIIKTEDYMYNGEWGQRSIKTYEYSAQYLNMLPFKCCALKLIDEGIPQFLKVSRLEWIPEVMGLNNDQNIDWSLPLDIYRRKSDSKPLFSAHIDTCPPSKTAVSISSFSDDIFGDITEDTAIDNAHGLDMQSGREGDGPCDKDGIIPNNKKTPPQSKNHKSDILKYFDL